MVFTTTYVTAFINVPAIEESTTRRQPETYKRVCQPLLQQDINLLYFGDLTMGNHVFEERTRLGFQDKTHIIPISFEELPTHKYLSAIQLAITSNGIMGLPTCSRYTPTYLATILSKTFLLNRAATENPFHTTHFCWHDFGFYHLKETYWSPFQKITPSLYSDIDSTWARAGDRIKIALVAPFIGLHSPVFNPAKLCSKDQNIVAGAFFGGNNAAVSWLTVAYTYLLESLLSMNFITNEEGILSQLFVTSPDHFDINANYYVTCLPNFASTRSGPERLSLQLYDCHKLGWHEQVIQLCWKALAGVQQRYVTYPPHVLRDIFQFYLAALTKIESPDVRYVKWEATHRKAIETTDSDALPWCYHHGSDSLYNDIRQVPTPFTLADLFREALTTPGCVGFTTSGWLKSKIQIPLRSAGYSPLDGIFVLIPV